MSKIFNLSKEILPYSNASKSCRHMNTLIRLLLWDIWEQSDMGLLWLQNYISVQNLWIIRVLARMTVIDIFNSLRLLPLSLLISLLLAQITNTVYTDTIVKITIIKMPWQVKFQILVTYCLAVIVAKAQSEEIGSKCI